MIDGGAGPVATRRTAERSVGAALGRYGRSIMLLLALGVGFGCLGALARTPSDHPSAWMLVVTGLGGEPDYEVDFALQGDSVARHAEGAGAEVTRLAGEAASRSGIQAAIGEIAAASTETDAVIVHLIGHGTFDGERYRFNVPGPDPTAEDLARWLAAVAAKRQLAVIATSASGAAHEPLERVGRVVVTATRHGRERNATVFGRFWADALASPGADIDKDERISAEEAFRFAEQAVARYFEDEQRIATEHPRLEGDAGVFVVARTAPEAPVDPGVVHLVDRVAVLTDAIDALKADRRVLTDEDYFTRLQELLMELATVEQELAGKDGEQDAGEDGGDPVPFLDGGL